MEVYVFHIVTFYMAIFSTLILSLTDLLDFLSWYPCTLLFLLTFHALHWSALFLKLHKPCNTGVQPYHSVLSSWYIAVFSLWMFCLGFSFHSYNKLTCNFNSWYSPCQILVSMICYLQKTICRVFLLLFSRRIPMNMDSFISKIFNIIYQESHWA